MKSEIVEKINELQESIKVLSEKDHSHDELGVANGFHDAEKYKEIFCDYSIDLLQKTILYIDHLNELLIEESIDRIKIALDKIVLNLNGIERLVAEGVHTPNYPAQRENLSDKIQQQSVSVKKQLRTLEIELKLAEISQKLSQIDFIQDIRKEAEAEVRRATEAANNAEKAANNAHKVLNAAQNKTVQKGVEDSASHFGSLYNHHKNYELCWLLAFIGSALAVIASVIYALSIEIPEEVTLNTFVSLIKRLVFVSVPSVFLRLTLTKYNAERNLRIIYGHREKVLEQYKSFEAGIGDDADAKNSFRIEVARYIFSDPKSNYGIAAEGRPSEININPIMSTVDRVVGKTYKGQP